MWRTTVQETDTRPLKNISVTDPAENAAVSTAILDTYSCVTITTTTTGNAQTLQDPTNTIKTQRFSVVNNDTSTDVISINWTNLWVWEVTYFMWDWSAWTNEASSSLWYTPENVANKSTTLDADKASDTKYSSTKSIYDWAIVLFANIAWSITQAFSALTIKLWHTTDTTIARVSAWVISVAWIVIPSISSTNTFTNKRITTRVNTIASSATPTPAWNTTDEFTVTALAENAVFAAPTWTPTDWQVLVIRILDDWSAYTLGWNAIYRASTDLALPTTTIIDQTLYLEFLYNDANSTWDMVGLLNNFA